MFSAHLECLFRGRMSCPCSRGIHHDILSTVVSFLKGAIHFSVIAILYGWLKTIIITFKIMVSPMQWNALTAKIAKWSIENCALERERKSKVFHLFLTRKEHHEILEPISDWHTHTQKEENGTLVMKYTYYLIKPCQTCRNQKYAILMWRKG